MYSKGFGGWGSLENAQFIYENVEPRLNAKLKVIKNYDLKLTEIYTVIIHYDN